MLTADFGFVAEHNLQVVSNNKSILAVLVVPRRGSAIRITPKGWFVEETAQPVPHDNATAQESFGIVRDDTGASFYRYAAPIQFSGVPWGRIQIDFSTDDYDASIQQMYRQLASISLAAVLVVLTMGYFFARWLTRPIALISAAAARVAGGDLDAHVKVDRNDEIGALSVSFNQMVDALQQSRQHTQNYRYELEQEVALRTEELDALNRSLDARVRDEVGKRKQQEALLIQQSRLAAMGEMIGSIAHQWRQPLNALGLVMQNIRMQHSMGQLTDESMTRMTDKGERLMARMSSTIDEFRNFFKPSKIQENFNLRQTMMSAADIMEGTFKNASIELTVVCDESIELFGIAGELAQVLLNLLSNSRDALKASGQGAPRILMLATVVPNGVRIDVEDNGGGIAPDVIGKIFEPYFTTKDEGQGTGIGLYMSKMIVESYLRGHMEASNTADGARFTVELSTKPVGFADSRPQAFQ
jgi:C4-dicarboxylate-specific signal transduction histidine kinase